MRARSTRCAPASRCRSTSPGSTSCRAQPRAPALRDRHLGALESSRLLFCCVDTPPTYSGDADLSRVEAVVAELPEGADHALVMKSTVPAGTGAAIVRQRPDLAYVSCPEFLKEGSAVSDFLQPDRVVIGADAGVGVGGRRGRRGLRAARRRDRPHRRRLGGDDQARLERVPRRRRSRSSTRSRTSARRSAPTSTEVARGMGMDAGSAPKFLNAGIGWGGSCFPKDTSR